ncbi:MAG TPA: PBP1A family penicillin-binding protein [Acidobacteriota bacterium]|nr:PBP1A family penicillin-binding protein [Acidobacteriota bacterium]
MKISDIWGSIARLNAKARILFAICAGGFLLICYLIVLYFHSWWAVENYLRSEKWPLPSTLYAEAPVLRVGMPAKSKSLVDYFRRLNYHKHAPNQTIKQDGTYAVSINSVFFQKRQLISGNPKPHAIRVEIKSDRVSKIVDLNTSHSLSTYELEPIAIRSLFGKKVEKRVLVPYPNVPEHMIQAVVAIEDRRFFRHYGVDFAAIARAIFNNLGNNKLSQGGSTITQQLAKNTFLTRERTIQRKIREAILATVLEARLSKQKILEMYLNEIYLGQQGSVGIHGIGEASRFYFAKDAEHLTVPEAALLAGIIQAPSAWNPYNHPKEAKKRRDTVLQAMRNVGFITSRQYDLWAKSPISVRSMDTRMDAAPYFGDLVEAQLIDKYDKNTVHKKNLAIFTTLNLEMQEAAEQALKNGLAKIDANRYSKSRKNIQGCLIAIEPSTGAVRALVGGRTYAPGQFNRVKQAPRQPGSAFKPFVYAVAFEQAFSTLQSSRVKSSNLSFFTPATLVRDEPWLLHYSNKEWEPKNYDGYYHGDVTLRTALAHSLNVPTARLANAVGLKRISSVAEDLGFTNVKPFPSLALGTFEASPWQMAEAYTVFANEGVRTSLNMVKTIYNSEGTVLESGKIVQQRIFHPETAFIITDMLRSVMIHGTAASSQRSGFNRPAAGKTGTTDEYRDAWFAGYTPQLLCIVWVGYDDNTSIQMNGAQAALPIWLEFMKKATAKLPAENFEVPDGIVLRKIDPTNGQRATESCPVVIDEIFIRGTEPQQYCEDHDEWEWANNSHQSGRKWWRPDSIWKKFRRLFRD